MYTAVDFYAQLVPRTVKIYDVVIITRMLSEMTDDVLAPEMQTAVSPPADEFPEGRFRKRLIGAKLP